MKIEIEQETDKRWITEVPSIAGALAYGESRQEAVAKVETLVLRILADRLEPNAPAQGLARATYGD